MTTGKLAAMARASSAEQHTIIGLAKLKPFQQSLNVAVFGQVNGIGVRAENGMPLFPALAIISAGLPAKLPDAHQPSCRFLVHDREFPHLLASAAQNKRQMCHNRSIQFRDCN